MSFVSFVPFPSAFFPYEHHEKPHGTPCTGSRYAHWQQCWGKVSAHPGHLTWQDLTMWSMVSAMGMGPSGWRLELAFNCWRCLRFGVQTLQTTSPPVNRTLRHNLVRSSHCGLAPYQWQHLFQQWIWNVGCNSRSVFLDCIAGLRFSLRQVVLIFKLIHYVWWLSLSLFGSSALLQEADE